MRPGDGILLDTCAMIWLSQGDAVAEGALDAIGRARLNDHPIAVSAMSAWELGMLTAKGRISSTMPALRWFEEFVRRAGVSVLEASPPILIASSFLPHPLHGDPVDRILIATARELDMPIMTRDKAILGYGAAGNVRTIGC